MEGGQDHSLLVRSRRAEESQARAGQSLPTDCAQEKAATTATKGCGGTAITQQCERAIADPLSLNDVKETREKKGSSLPLCHRLRADDVELICGE